MALEHQRQLSAAVTARSRSLLFRLGRIAFPALVVVFIRAFVPLALVSLPTSYVSDCEKSSKGEERNDDD